MAYTPINTDGSNNPQGYWWAQSEKDLCHRIFNYVSFLEKGQPYVMEDAKRNLKLYGNTDVFGTTPRAYSHNRIDRLKLNVIKSICDTAVSKITKNKIKPTFLTSNGDQSIQTRAKKLEKFSLGQLHETDFYAMARRTVLDACVFGTGVLKIYNIGKEIKIDRVIGPIELRVDQADGLYGKPKSLFHVKYFHREVLLDLFPKHKKEIINAAKANPYDDRALAHAETQTDMIKVEEAWHLPSGKGAKDGVHSICIENKTLLLEPYEKDYFPFAFLHWTEAISGFWGTGIADILVGIQVEINKILKENQMIFHLCDIPQTWLQDGSHIVTSQMDNQIGAIHTFSGSPPLFNSSNGKVSQERFNYLIWLIKQAFEITGMSQLSAQSQKPEGLDSGKALRTYHDIETERYASFIRGYEDFTLDVVRQMLCLGRHIDETEEGGYDVLVDNGKFSERIKWKEIDMDETKYVMRVYPTSLLSDEPAGRLRDVEELIGAGLYSPEEGRKLLDFPDTAALNSELNAPIEDIEMVIETFTEKGIYLAPEPFQDLALGLGKMQRAYLRAKLNKVPEGRLELFRRWMAEAAAMLAPPEPPMPQVAPETPPAAGPDPMQGDQPPLSVVPGAQGAV